MIGGRVARSQAGSLTYLGITGGSLRTALQCCPLSSFLYEGRGEILWRGGDTGACGKVHLLCVQGEKGMFRELHVRRSDSPGFLCSPCFHKGKEQV